MAYSKVQDFPFVKNAAADNGTDLGIDKTVENLPVMRELLNSTGRGFCLAKWTQVTMHLGTGMTHSCHHPTPHKIPLEEIEVNPSALHNTLFKKQQRKLMLNGERPNECDYCWRIEDNTNEFSDRIEKSLDKWSLIDHDKIVGSTGDEDVYPRYVEISWSNTCNFKCSYCGPSFSSKWAEEIKEHGYYELPHDHGYNWTDNLQILEREHNPYIDAFWKWWPEASKHIHTLRITGGEPLLSKHTFKVMESLIENPNPNLELNINSNGCPPDQLWARFIDLVNQLTANGCIKKFTLFTSAEAYGDQCDYIRHGMNFVKFKQNIEQFLQETKGTRVTIMSAFNLLSLPTFQRLLEWVLNLKKRHNQNGLFEWFEKQNLQVLDATAKSNLPPEYLQGDWQTFAQRARYTERVGIDIPYIREPQFLDVKIATPDLLEKYLVPALNYMYSNIKVQEWNDTMGFDIMEAAKLKRILVQFVTKIMKNAREDHTTEEEWISKCRHRFITFIDEHDRRRGTDFKATFPELNRFYAICKLEEQRLSTPKNHE